MTDQPAPTALTQAAAQRTADAEQRVRHALRAMDRDGVAITFAAVAARARVSRAFLYEHPDLRVEIAALRGAPGAPTDGLPQRQRMSEASLRARLRDALEANVRYREEIGRLRDELALAHGRNRELERQLRTGRH